MALFTTSKEPGINPPPCATAALVVPACMFAPDPGAGFGEDDVPDGEASEDGEGAHGESEDHLNFSSKVGPPAAAFGFRSKSPAPPVNPIYKRTRCSRGGVEEMH